MRRPLSSAVVESDVDRESAPAGVFRRRHSLRKLEGRGRDRGAALVRLGALRLLVDFHLVLESPDRLAQSLAETGQPIGAEDEDHDDENDDQFPSDRRDQSARASVQSASYDLSLRFPIVDRFPAAVPRNAATRCARGADPDTRPTRFRVTLGGQMADSLRIRRSGGPGRAGPVRRAAPPGRPAARAGAVPAGAPRSVRQA